MSVRGPETGVIIEERAGERYAVILGQDEDSNITVPEKDDNN